MYNSAFSYIFPTWFLHYKHLFVPKKDGIWLNRKTQDAFLLRHYVIFSAIKQIIIMPRIGIEEIGVLFLFVNKFVQQTES